MSKFRIKMKLQGFELEIEGNREDASVIGRNIGDQLSGMLSPGMNIIDGEIAVEHAPTAPAAVLVEDASKRKIRRRAKPVVNGQERSQTIDFRHDPAKYGMPTQQWNTSDKAIWLLYVVNSTAQIGELSTGQIVKTFNTHFRQAKTVTNSNVSRDLGKLKVASPSLVGEDTTKNPATWFLTDEGKKRVHKLIVESLSPKAA